MLAGVNLIANAVGATLGPKGRNVLMEPLASWHPPIISKDGVTVAREIYVSNQFQDVAIQALKKIAMNCNDSAGLFLHFLYIVFIFFGFIHFFKCFTKAFLSFFLCEFAYCETIILATLPYTLFHKV